jgi:hypothetical protein
MRYSILPLSSEPQEVSGSFPIYNCCKAEEAEDDYPLTNK